MRIGLPSPVAAEYLAECRNLVAGLRGVPHTAQRSFDIVLADRMAGAIEDVTAIVVADDSLPAPIDPAVCVSDQLRQRRALVPTDDVARWGVITNDVLLCENGFAAADLEYLCDRSSLENVRWLVAASAWVLAHSAVDSSRLLRRTLKRLREREDLDNALAAMSRSDDHAKRMSVLANAVLRGETLGEQQSPGWWTPGPHYEPEEQA